MRGQDVQAVALAGEVQQRVDLADAVSVGDGGHPKLLLLEREVDRLAGVVLEMLDRGARVDEMRICVVLDQRDDRAQAGQVAGGNAVGGARVFQGSSLGTQVVKVFDLAAARTGLRDADASSAGFDPLTVATTAFDHKAYYPGAHEVRIRITGDRMTGRLLGAQIVGHREAEVAKRIDIPAVAMFDKMTVRDMSDLDLSYTPPLGSPWDVIQVAARLSRGVLDPRRRRDPFGDRDGTVPRLPARGPGRAAVDPRLDPDRAMTLLHTVRSPRSEHVDEADAFLPAEVLRGPSSWVHRTLWARGRSRGVVAGLLDLLFPTFSSYLLSGARHQPDRHGLGLAANDGPHDQRPVPVVLRVVGGVDTAVHARNGLGEAHVPLQATGSDPTGAAGLRAAEPRVVRAASGPDVQLVVGPDDPHRHVGAQRAVPAEGRELQLTRLADTA